MTPNALKMSYNIFSSISGSKFPINTLAPMSKLLVLEAAWKSKENASKLHNLNLIDVGVH